VVLLARLQQGSEFRLMIDIREGLKSLKLRQLEVTVQEGIDVVH